MKAPLVLGIDLGTSSLGWALVRKQDGKPAGIHSMGVRIFDEALEGRVVDGRGQTRNVARREARLIRRNIERRARRLARLAHVLQNAGLLPPGDLSSPIARHEFFKALDRPFDDQPGHCGDGKGMYTLRARALDEKLALHELGRALYHLGQRRGFLSNRKAPPKKDEKPGEVKSAIEGLAANIKAVEARTLGEYYASAEVNPHEERIRTRYTSRAMYDEEFGQIWQAQKAWHPELTDELRKRIHHVTFHQRPLKIKKSTIGKCEVEPQYRRAPVALLSSQRFRLLQAVNNLKVNGRDLTADERTKLLEALENKGDLKFTAARALLGLRGTKFNLEEGGEEKLPGSRTAADLRGIFRERWDTFSGSDRDQIVEDMRSIVKDETLRKRGERKWGLMPEAAKKFSEIALEDGYIGFSRQALKKLLPEMEKGIPTQTAIRKLYPERFVHEGEPLPALPPVKSDVFTELRNPLVERALTELRKVVNAIIERHGRPESIHIELARDLRKNAKQRESTWKKGRDNQRERTRAAARLAEAGISDPSRNDVLKVLLMDECNQECPYTGKHISMASLFGPHPQFDIEHIIPLDRSLDDSFVNKTLCDAHENRNRKHNHTPFEAYSGTDRWDEIIARVKRFQGGAADEKLRRFEMDVKALEAELSDFTSRQLNDTRYASRKAKEYLGFLYSGMNDDGIDAKGKRRVQASPGIVTSFLREEWGLHRILGDGPGKNRADHRHHAIDALVIALTEPATVQILSEAAKGALMARRRRFAPIGEPWPGFLAETKKAVDAIAVSPRLDHRVKGKLHAESNYGVRTDGEGVQWVQMRKPLERLSAKEIGNIVDPRVRAIVQRHLDQHGDLKKAFADPENHPWVTTPDGKRYIHRVSIKGRLATFAVGRDRRTRHVETESNHHMEIVGVLGGLGQVIKWEGHVVTLYEAKKRLAAGEPVIKRDWGEGLRFVFSLAKGDVVEINAPDSSRSLYDVRSIYPVQQRYHGLRLAPLRDARKAEEIKKAGDTKEALVEPLRKLDCRKVVVTPLGEVRYAND